MAGAGEKAAGGGGGENKRKYPIRWEDYELYEEVGQGVSAIVYRALCKTFDEIVAVKVLDFERTNSDLVRTRSRSEPIDRSTSSDRGRVSFGGW
jgi:serine/threonine-protein kinase OSR1/STK39